MRLNARHLTAAILAMVTLAGGSTMAQGEGSNGPERFNAIAIANDQFGSAAGRVIVRVTRWSTDGQRDRLVNALREHGADAMLDDIRKMPRVGRIYTPDNIGYELHYAHQTIDEEGNRQIVIATDRPIAFWEHHLRSRTVDYPFTVVQMEIDRDGNGKGTLSPMTRISIEGDNLVLENFSIAPVMLTKIETETDGN